MLPRKALQNALTRRNVGLSVVFRNLLAQQRPDRSEPYKAARARLLMEWDMELSVVLESELVEVAIPEMAVHRLSLPLRACRCLSTALPGLDIRTRTFEAADALLAMS